MRLSQDDEYRIGEVWINKVTKDKYVVIDFEECEDSYYDIVCLLKESDYLSKVGKGGFELESLEVEIFDKNSECEYIRTGIIHENIGYCKTYYFNYNHLNVVF